MAICKICNSEYHSCPSCDYTWFDGYSVCSSDCATRSPSFHILLDSIKSLNLSIEQMDKLFWILEDSGGEKILNALAVITKE